MSRQRSHCFLALTGVLALLLSLTLAPSLRAHTQAQEAGSPSAASATPLSITWIDNFDGPPLNSRWLWMNEDPTHWSLTDPPGFLHIITQQQNNNYLVQNTPGGDYEIETHVFIEPTENFQQGGPDIYSTTDRQLLAQEEELARKVRELEAAIAAQPNLEAQIRGLLRLRNNLSAALLEKGPATVAKILQDAGLQMLVEENQIVEVRVA